MRRPAEIAIVILVLVSFLSALLWIAVHSQKQAILSRQLVRAVNSGNAVAVERLLDEGANPNTREGSRPPPSWLVSIWDNLRHRKSHSAILGNPVLFQAVDDEQPSIVAALVDHGANVNAVGDTEPDPKYRSVAMLEDVGGGISSAIRVKIAQILIHYGAKVNIRDGMGDTPLLDEMNPKMVKLLLSAGAQVDARDDLNQTPLIRLVAYQQPSDGEEGDTIAIFRELLAAGADVNARDDAGYTALMNASYGGLTRVVNFLLAHGARLDYRGTYNHENALDLAEDEKNMRIVALLKAAGAKP